MKTKEEIAQVLYDNFNCVQHNCMACTHTLDDDNDDACYGCENYKHWRLSKTYIEKVLEDDLGLE